MNRYTIYCTPEQTRKALELGAPIKYLDESRVSKVTIQDNALYIPEKWGYFLYPTAEQMLGWLEAQDGIKEISAYCDVTGTTWYFDIYGYKGNSLVTIKDISNSYGYSSRKEATLAAIDAALEYLTNNKK